MSKRKSVKMRKVMITIDPDLHEQMKEVADKIGLSFSELVRRSLLMTFAPKPTE